MWLKAELGCQRKRGLWGEGVRTRADALGGAYDEDVFATKTLFVVFLFAALDVPILGEDAARYHAHLGLTMWWATNFPEMSILIWSIDDRHYYM
jgi:hypothetical protein